MIYFSSSLLNMNFMIILSTQSPLANPDWTKDAVERIRNMMDVLEKEKVVLEDNVETLTMYVSR